jgi:hypothetical protein
MIDHPSAIAGEAEALRERESRGTLSRRSEDCVSQGVEMAYWT